MKSSPASAPARIHPGAAVGAIHLIVADLDLSLGFYRDALGWRPVAEAPGAASTEARLSADGQPPAQIRLTEQRGAKPQPRNTSGLYHTALLHPTRRALARTVRRLADLGVRIHGASDHLVSEALYLADPDGHGIELYADRPRESWPRRDGQLVLDSLPLDLDRLMAEVGDDNPWTGADPETHIGHIHLRTGDLDAAGRFYRDLLGFEEMARYGDTALFLGAGGYHHHIGLNTWAGVGVPPPPSTSARLTDWTITVPDAGAIAEIVRRVRETAPERLLSEDRVPSHPMVRLAAPDGLEVWLVTHTRPA